MYKSMCLYNYGMYRWNDYVSVCAIDYHWYGVILVDCVLSVVCIYEGNI